MNTKKKIKKLDKILIGLALFIVSFIITMIVIFIKTGIEMSTLETVVLGAGSIEAIVTAVIKLYGDKQQRQLFKQQETDSF